MTSLPEADTFASYRVNHLLLLIGGNPVPNAVAGPLLVKEGGLITLICSRDTFEKVGKPLKAYLESQRGKRGPDNYTVVLSDDYKVEEADPCSVYQKVSKALNDVKEGNVGLHYTGGTKAMAVHAYDAARNAVGNWKNEESDREGIYSYLDARSLSLIFDPEDKWTHNASKREVVEKQKVTLVELLNLHGGRLPNQPNQTLPLKHTVQTLALLSARNIVYPVQQWKKTILKPVMGALKGSNWNWHTTTTLGNTPLKFNTASNLYLPTELVNAFKNDGVTVLDTGNEVLSLSQIAARLRPFGYTKTGEIWGWFSGYWLEFYVLSALQKIAVACGLEDIGQSVEPSFSGIAGAEKFELDVVALRGYQLFGFSCCVEAKDANEDNPKLKLKLIEAILRAQQMGGDAARVALVCNADAVEKQNLLSQAKILLDIDNRVQVFGRDDLLDLSGNIAKWIKELDKEVNKVRGVR